MQCPVCGSDDVEREEGLPVASCRACGEVFEAPPDTPPPPELPPPGVRLKRDGDGVQFVLEWEPTRIAAWILFGLGVMMLQEPSLDASFLMRVPLALGLGYAAIVYTVNRTEILVTPAGIAMDHRPLWWPGTGRLVARADLTQLYCRRKTRTHRGREYHTYDLVARLAGGKEVVLHRGATDPDAARYIERQVEGALGIEDVPVAGEHHPGWGG